MNNLVPLLFLIFLTTGCDRSPESAATTQSSIADESTIVKESEAALSVRWTSAVEDFGLRRLEEMDDATSKAVPLGLDGKSPVVIEIGPDTNLYQIKESDRRIEIVNCDDYYALASGQYAPASNDDSLRIAVFARPCDTLRYLKLAKPAKYSFVESLTLDTDTTKELIPLIGVKQDLDFKAPNDAAYLKFHFEPKGAILPNSDGTVRIGDIGAAVIVERLAWADFDGDGAEDVLLFVRGKAQYVNLSYHKIVTRLEDKGPLIAVDVDPYAEFRR
ncbi:MAG TPA: hypothetical protein P5081_19560 [Phycisphaerae bacterium]|nr:hypothetical protein [Phycisphaerae bacterium]